MNAFELPDINLNKELKKCKRDDDANKNCKNGYSQKIIKTSFGEVDVDIWMDLRDYLMLLKLFFLRLTSNVA